MQRLKSRAAQRLLLAGGTLALALTVTAVLVPATSPIPTQAPGNGGPPRVVAWNDLGMHCIDPDFSVFSILPPFNTVNAHVLRGGEMLGASDGITVTYESVVDSTGSINTTSIGKTNFWDHAPALFGVTLPLDVGLAGNAMPGLANVAQSMHFDSTHSWFTGEGIPITPIDDTFDKNPYPLMRIVARNAMGLEIASTTTVVPNSQELLCSQCHESGGSPDARPAAGWVFDPDPLRDDRLNILRLHDENQLGNPKFVRALAIAGYSSQGLYDTAVGQGTSILCARCHGSNALPGTGLPDIVPLTQAMHGYHANVVNPQQTVLDSVSERTVCYTCHPGFDTQCLRGAMGKAIGPGGDFSMNCQSCHGTMSAVGDPARVGWFDQPTCQNCHSGSATLNSGEIRYTSAFDDTGSLRTPASNLFATNPDTPIQGFSLYRFSSGHGDLQCSACHGPPHAIYPTNFENDNVQSLELQGHIGTITDCTVCHTNLEDDEVQGPHGMHPVGSKWVQDIHKDEAEGSLNSCRACHGQDLRGTVLSYAQGDRSYGTPFGQKDFYRGFQIGCYACHDGPDDDDNNPNRAPVAANHSLSTPSDAAARVDLTSTDADQDVLSYRIVSQPEHGTVALSGSSARYLPQRDYRGLDSFTYAAWDGQTNSNLATIVVDVSGPDCGIRVERFGFGCEGQNGTVPVLDTSPCTPSGNFVKVRVTDGPPGGLAILVLGLGESQRDMGNGCISRVLSVKESIAIPLGSAATNAGTGVATIQIPGQLSRPMILQALCRDSSMTGSTALTNAIRITRD